MFLAKSSVVALACVIALSGCSQRRHAVAGDGGASAEPKAANAGYVTPPAVDLVEAGQGVLILGGTATAGARVRLATPGGQAALADADSSGRWRLALPSTSTPQLFGLSATAKGRPAQAQGYILVTPAGQAALLRAGAGAIRVDRKGRPGLAAFDIDRDGEAVVSGFAPKGAALLIHLDGRQVAQARADDAGRFAVPLATPIGPGAHRLQLFGDGFTDSAEVRVSPAAPLAGPPLRSQFTGAGLRVDWLTPGGGVQTTFLMH